MKMIKIISGIVISLGVIQAAYAAPMPPVGKWQCFATNNRGARWFHNANERHRAMIGAKKRCYAAGSRHCYINRNECRYNSGDLWRCRVRDHRGRIWTASAHTAKHACHRARRLCQHWHNKRGVNKYICHVVGERRT